GEPHLLPRRPRGPASLGLRVRRLPGLRAARPRLRGLGGGRAFDARRGRRQMSYAVKEIFLTLQGEGGQAGRPAVFCRFAGCNLWSGREQDRAAAVCSFCDTDFVGLDGRGGGRFADADALADAVQAAWQGGPEDRLVVLTGGE